MRSISYWFGFNNARRFALLFLNEFLCQFVAGLELGYRQALDAELGSVAVLDVAEALYLTKSALDTQTVIVIATMQAFRRENKEGLLVYRSSGNLMSHFQGVPEEILKEVERNADGTFDYSLCNVFRVRKPL